MEKLGFKGKAGESRHTLLHGGTIPSVHFIGLGGRGKLSAEKLGRQIHAWAASCPSGVCVGLSPTLLRVPKTESLSAALRILAGSDYLFQDFLKEKRGEKKAHLLIPAGIGEAEAALNVRKALALKEGCRVARDLGHAPGNMLTPLAFAAKAQSLGEKYGWSVEVLGTKELEKRHLPGLVMVGRSSENPPVLVRIQAGRKADRILIGKGVIFDSGGISIKPAAGMDEMKYDKCGAAAALGALVALSETGNAEGVVVYLPLADNMPGGNAFRPGDVLTWPDGTSVEIMTTDAEGRLVLADALAMAAQEKPACIITLATLTGAMRFSLGTVAAGLFTRNAGLRDRILKAGYATAEFCWELPLWEEYDEMVKGDISTLKNSTAGAAGSITAAAFLQVFAKKIPFAHVDIAYMATRPSSDKKSKGPTGFGVALMARALLEDAD